MNCTELQQKKFQLERAISATRDEIRKRNDAAASGAATVIAGAATPYVIEGVKNVISNPKDRKNVKKSEFEEIVSGVVKYGRIALMLFGVVNAADGVIQSSNLQQLLVEQEKELAEVERQISRQC